MTRMVIGGDNRSTDFIRVIGVIRGEYGSHAKLSLDAAATPETRFLPTTSASVGSWELPSFNFFDA